jgi:hypothetical protein
MYRNVENILKKELHQQGLALRDAYSGTPRFSRNSVLLNRMIQP